MVSPQQTEYKMYELTKSIKCENSPSHDSYHNIICQKQNIGELWVEKGYRIDENGVKSKSLTVFRYIVAFIWKGVTVFKKFEVDGNFVDSTWKTNYCTFSEETYKTSREAKKSALWYLDHVFGSIGKIERVGCTYKRIFHHSEVFTMISKERVYDKQSGYTSEIATMRDPNGNLEEWDLTFDTGKSWELVHVNDADISGYDDSWQNPRYTPVEETPVEETPVETVETTQTNNQSTTEEPLQVTPQPEEPTMAQPTKIIVVIYHSGLTKWYPFTLENMESLVWDFQNIDDIQIIEQGE